MSKNIEVASRAGGATNIREGGNLYIILVAIRMASLLYGVDMTTPENRPYTSARRVTISRCTHQIHVIFGVGLRV